MFEVKTMVWLTAKAKKKFKNRHTGKTYNKGDTIKVRTTKEVASYMPNETKEYKITKRRR